MRIKAQNSVPREQIRLPASPNHWTILLESPESQVECPGSRDQSWSHPSSESRAAIPEPPEGAGVQVSSSPLGLFQPLEACRIMWPVWDPLSFLWLSRWIDL